MLGLFAAPAAWTPPPCFPDRRRTILGAALSLVPPPPAPLLADDLPLLRPQRLLSTESVTAQALDGLLHSSRVYAVKSDSSKKLAPSTKQINTARLLRTLGSKRAIFLGEHHPDLRDHLLQAALLQHLHSSTGRPLAVGVEAVQRQFQSVLDDYVARRIDEEALFIRTEWERRWYWPFTGYAPIFRFCREHGLKLVALDVDSEDKAKVELGGLASLSTATLRQYVPDREAFDQFGATYVRRVRLAHATAALRFAKEAWAEDDDEHHGGTHHDV